MASLRVEAVDRRGSSPMAARKGAEFAVVTLNVRERLGKFIALGPGTCSCACPSGLSSTDSARAQLLRAAAPSSSACRRTLAPGILHRTQGRETLGT